MKISTLLLALLLCATAGNSVAQTVTQDKETQSGASKPVANSAVPEGFPDEFGVYLKTDRGWERLRQNKAEKTEIKRGGFTQWTGIGIGGMHIKLNYRGSQAQLQTTQPRPAFYVRMSDANRAQELVIFRFKQSKNQRQIETAEISGERTGGSETRSKASTFTVAVRRLAPEVFLVTPESDLETGEYILASGSGNEGYDFGIGGTPLASK